MNNNLEFENNDPNPNDFENNHPRTNYGEGFSKERFTKEDMIKFAEFIVSYPDKNRNSFGEILHAKSKYDGAERTIDLLDIWINKK